MKNYIPGNPMRQRWLVPFLFLLFSSVIVHAQSAQVKGKVTDETGGGMPGATVKVKGKTA